MRIVRALAVTALLVAPSLGHASLEDDGVWAGGLWASTVWADGVWREGDAPVDDTEGALTTEFTSSAVPGTAVYLRGTAYTPAGARYVAECTTPDVYLAAVGHRNDGATCIDPAGSVEAEVGGWALTNIGEVVAAECSPEFYVNGVPRDAETGSVCMTNVD